MTQNNPQTTSSYIIHNSAIVPVYYFRGALPPLMDTEPDHNGWLICLSLSREGDTCLLPLAWESQQITADDPRPRLTPLQSTTHTHALYSSAVKNTLAQLQNNGWHINGRLTIHFTGADTEPNFHQQTQSCLWQTPE
ncbi:MAG: hypothetical protein D6835_03700 [Candidatus Thermofonsia bacterium]|nr:MAG: hypothetical protein D6835_03700 [Candidatus Thermofonsia bacterium]